MARISMLVHLKMIATHANAVMRAYPISTSLTVTGIKAAAADALVQTAIQGGQQLDMRRIAMFGAFGTCYQGGFQYWMFNHVVERRFPGRSISQTIKKVLAVNFLIDPLCLFPTFYVFKRALTTGAVSAATARDAMIDYYCNCYEDWFNSWSVWLPGHMVTYGVCAQHLRMPWVALLSFGYLLILSATRGAATTPAETIKRHRQSVSAEGAAGSTCAASPTLVCRSVTANESVR